MKSKTAKKSKKPKSIKTKPIRKQVATKKVTKSYANQPKENTPKIKSDATITSVVKKSTYIDQQHSVILNENRNISNNNSSVNKFLTAQINNMALIKKPIPTINTTTPSKKQNELLRESYKNFSISSPKEASKTSVFSNGAAIAANPNKITPMPRITSVTSISKFETNKKSVENPNELNKEVVETIFESTLVESIISNPIAETDEIKTNYSKPILTIIAPSKASNSTVSTNTVNLFNTHFPKFFNYYYQNSGNSSNFKNNIEDNSHKEPGKVYLSYIEKIKSAKKQNPVKQIEIIDLTEDDTNLK